MFCDVLLCVYDVFDVVVMLLKKCEGIDKMLKFVCYVVLFVFGEVKVCVRLSVELSEFVCVMMVLECLIGDVRCVYRLGKFLGNVWDFCDEVWENEGVGKCGRA